MSASLNNSISESTKETSNYILYRVDKRLPCDLFSMPQKPVYDMDNSAEQLHVFGNFHNNVREKLQAYKVEMKAKQHKKNNIKYQGRR